MSSTSPSPPEASMKALMDAVAQVSSHTDAVGSPDVDTKNPFAYPVTAGAPPAGPIVPQAAYSAPIGAVSKKSGPLRKRNHDSVLAAHEAAVDVDEVIPLIAKRARLSKQERDERRTKRLEQNRLAAIESRRRKKHMEEELKKSVVFYTKANSDIKAQNAELERQLLVAKQKVLLMNQDNNATKAESDAAAMVATEAATTLEKQAAPQGGSRLATEPTTQAASHVVSSLFPSPPNAELEKQAGQAQFAATQALYKSMGYPSGAARVAASTFSQFIGQTGNVPGMTPPITTTAATHKTTPVTTPALVPPTTASTAATTNDIDGTEYVNALHRFAMQQAAAANAAAAAANAALQACQLHSQFSSNGSTSPSSIASPSALVVPSLPFPNAAIGGMMWPFQNPTPSMKKD